MNSAAVAARPGGGISLPFLVAALIAGSLVYINLGKFIGPIAFANVYALSRSYAFAFASVAVPALAALACLVAADRSGRQAGIRGR